MSTQQFMSRADLDGPDLGPEPSVNDLAGAVNVASRSIGRASGGGLVSAIALAAVLGASVMLAANSRENPPSLAPAGPAAHQLRFILNALLVPALDGDAVPLRWVDPRPRSHCGPRTEVRVNREPLVAGALVPDTPFELEWQADGCRPFGTNGLQFDGRVRLMVFRDERRFSALVEPAGLRVRFAGHEIPWTRPIVARLPVEGDAAEPIDLTDERRDE